jgi:tripartite-type tricarboxylate transporter receptor subunit TctC
VRVNIRLSAARSISPALGRSLIVGLVTAQAVLAAASPATAQGYPTRPVVIIVPFAAGGGNDVLARLLAQRMGATLGQQLVIENRAGAGGTVGARAVAKAPPRPRPTATR